MKFTTTTMGSEAVFRPQADEYMGHVTNVRQKLLQCGIRHVRLAWGEAARLAHVVRPDEHIRAAVAGHTGHGPALLLATSRRVIFYNAWPADGSFEEIPYGAITGIQHHMARLFADVMLLAAGNTYHLRKVNKHAAVSFVQFVAGWWRGSQAVVCPDPAIGFAPAGPPQRKCFTPEAQSFLRSHNTGVLSAIDQEGRAFGAAGLYVVDAADDIFIMTRSGTGKARNILGNQNVMFTVIEESGVPKALEVEGGAELELDPYIREVVCERLIYEWKRHQGAPPTMLSRLHHEAYVIIRIGPVWASYHECSNE